MSSISQHQSRRCAGARFAEPTDRGRLIASQSTGQPRASRLSLMVVSLLLFVSATVGVASGDAQASTPVDWKITALDLLSKDQYGRPVVEVWLEATGDVMSDRVTVSWTNAEFVETRPAGGLAERCSQEGGSGTCTFQVSVYPGSGAWLGRFVLVGNVESTWATSTFFLTEARPTNPNALRKIYVDANQTNNKSTIRGYRTDLATNFSRIAGADRIDTAIAIANDRSFERPVTTVAIARSDTFPDALAAGPLVARKNAVLLFTPTAQLDARVERWVTSNVPRGSEVIILGNSGAVSASVENRFATLGYRTSRLGGADRFETALAIDRAVGVDYRSGVLFLADGRSFADAVCAGAAASVQYRLSGASRAPGVLLLTDGRNIQPTLRAGSTATRHRRSL
jgi:hypothetical protein